MYFIETRFKRPLCIVHAFGKLLRILSKSSPAADVEEGVDSEFGVEIELGKLGV